MQKQVNTVILQFSQAREMMLAALDSAKKITGQELEKQLPYLSGNLNAQIKLLPYKGTAGRGRCNSQNDRALFMWNGVKIIDGEEEREYLIDFFATDYDRTTANLHSQIGHIQFVMLRPNMQSPHEIQLQDDEGVVIRFNENRLVDTHQSLCDFSNSSCNLQVFDPVVLTQEFYRYVILCEQKIQSAAKCCYHQNSLV